MDGQLLYTFLSLAMTRDTPRGKMVPVDGMKLVAALAHKYNIPVTWVVDSNSAQETHRLLSQWHRECGDDVVIQVDAIQALNKIGVAIPASKAEEIVILRQHLPEIISSEREKIREILPWTEANIASVNMKSEVLIEILENQGFIGLWGYRWSTIGEGDQAFGDIGCPWSFFYSSGDHHSAPAQNTGGIVAIESVSLDLNSAFYSGNNKIFSAEPGSLKISGLNADKDIAYPKTLLDQYLKNLPWNRFLLFLQQQPAYQMEYTSYDAYDKDTISDIAAIMEEFFQEASNNQNIKTLSLHQAINLYKSEFEYTESCSMAFDGILPLNANVNFYLPPEPKQKPPYPLTFFYYDKECQLIFKEGQMTPLEMRNYFRPPFESTYYLEKEMPSISSFRPSRDRDKLIMEFEIESIKQMPYGLVIWDDHSMFSLVSTNARTVKWIGNYLLFIRIDLEEGLNRMEVSLTI